MAIAKEGQALKQHRLLDTITETMPIAMGYLPLGAAYGLLVVESGIDWFWAPLMSMIIFAGALQFLSVSFLAVGMPLWEIAITTLIINFRHVFYGFSYPFEKLNQPIIKLYGIFCLTDETYSLLASKNSNDLDEKSIFLIQIFSHAYWIIGAFIGTLAAIIIPQSINGIEFTLTALFVVLTQEHYYKKTNHAAIGLAIIAAGIAFFVSTTQFLSVAMALFVALLTAKFYKEKS